MQSMYREIQKPASSGVVIESTYEAEEDLKKRGQSAQEAAGKALKKAYPNMLWRVAVSEDGSMLDLTLPNLSTEYGMGIHTNQSVLAIEAKAKRFGGELLERFNIDRVSGDGLVLKDRRGNAIFGPKGGV